MKFNSLLLMTLFATILTMTFALGSSTTPFQDCTALGNCLPVSSSAVVNNATFNANYSATSGTAQNALNLGGQTPSFYLNVGSSIAWSQITGAPNFNLGIWTNQNANNFLISNGTNVGYNNTILNNSINSLINTNSNIFENSTNPKDIRYCYANGTNSSGVNCQTVTLPDLTNYTTKNASIIPTQDNNFSLGSSIYRFSNIYGYNGYFTAINLANIYGVNGILTNVNATNISVVRISSANNSNLGIWFNQSAHTANGTDIIIGNITGL